MKKMSLALILAAMLLLCAPVMALAAGFSVSPSSEQTIEVPSNGVATIDFTFPDYEGELTIGKEDLPVNISPLGIVDISSGEVLTITISGDGTNNSYDGKLTFLASEETQVLVGVKVRLTVHVNCTTEILLAPNEGYGGGFTGTTSPSTIVAPDGAATLSIPIGTIVRNKDGAIIPVYKVKVESILNPPEPPVGTHIVGLAYNYEPSGATFDTPLVMTLHYDLSQIPEGADESDLVIAFWDGSQWITLECAVDTTAHTITAMVSHFTMFAVVATVSPVIIDPVIIDPVVIDPVVETPEVIPPEQPETVASVPPTTEEGDSDPESTGVPILVYLAILVGIAGASYGLWCLWRHYRQPS